ncbi:lytic transglycosylase domain-containing protein [Acidithiobacillus ferrooxidans]|uniref:lytic transglycosylase domain-containing protein n=1 Tax=Acidithiobacillus ferrooxidans TaxID=920 RepID=UPI00214C4C3D|nr:lytic transglycosylase domain-containing protein [Acidithiobacillus ferrooxidans]MCR2831429.1 lytic transglycosylase domain-containing protein [Acidithiobacillus ferrooxidans]
MDAKNHPHGRREQDKDEVDMIGLALLQKCAPEVAPVTMAAIVQTESGGWPWTIHDNTTGQSLRFKSQTQAVAMARILISQGHKLDMGIAQIDSENLGWLGLTARQVFNPCTNLQAAQRILVGAYHQAGASGTQSLYGAFQAYNSGNPSGDGHYAKVVYRQAGVKIPAIPGGQLAPWATRQVGGGVGMGKERGEDGSVPVRPVIMMPPRSWQPLAKDEDFASAVTRKQGTGQAKKGPSHQAAVTAIWTPAGGE